MAVGAGVSALNSEPRTPNPRRTPRGNVVVKMHDPQRSILEGVFSRGDRRLGPVVYEAWKRGARLDGWDETFDNRIWMDAYEAAGVDPDFYAHRERSYDELLPWDHIGLRIGRAYLEKSYDDVFEQINVERGVAGAPLPAVDGRVTP